MAPKNQIYQITILDWEKHNPKAKKNYKKSLISNNFLMDSKVRSLTPTGKLLFLSLLLLSGDSASAQVGVSLESLCYQSGVKPGSVQSQLDQLESLQLVRWSKPPPKERKKERRNILENKIGSNEPPQATQSGLESKPPKQSGPEKNFNHEKHLAEDQVSHAWEYFCVPKGFARVRSWTKERARLAKNISEKFTKEEIETAAKKVADSDFCRGESKSGWKAGIDFFLNEKKFVKLLEGAFDNKQQTAQTDSPKKFRLEL